MNDGVCTYDICNERCIRQFSSKYEWIYQDEVKGKGKAIPKVAWTSREGSRRLRLPDFMTVGT